jgi:zinc/manganese transport system substrate-binding protein
VRLINGLLAGVLLLGASSAQASLRVVTTTTDLKALVEAVGGEHVRVQSICKANQDPHYVQARPSFMVTLRDADLLVHVGLDLEIGWLPLLVDGARNPKIRAERAGSLNLGESIKVLGVPATTDAALGHLHPSGNPHYWLDPVRFRSLVPVVAQRLIELMPAQTKSLQQRADAYGAKLDRAIVGWAKRMAPLKGIKVLTYHDTFLYFLKRYGLIGAGVLENKPGVPPSPRHLARLIQQARSEKIPLLLHESFHNRKPSGLVADRSGAQLVVLPVSVGAEPGTQGYIRLIDRLVERLVTKAGR